MHKRQKELVWIYESVGIWSVAIYNIKTFFDHEAQCYSTLLWFISEVYELHCRLESLLTVTKR